MKQLLNSVLDVLGGIGTMGSTAAIDPSVLRLLWSVVQESDRRELLSLPDSNLAAALIHKLSNQRLLTGEEASSLFSYVDSKISLIRELATYPSLSV